MHSNYNSGNRCCQVLLRFICQAAPFFDSHDHLDPEDRKVSIERYIARTAPGRLRSLLRHIGIGADPVPATDDYLINAANRKQKLNEMFLNVLKDIGNKG